jgi:prefoldin subunit 5
VPWFVPMITAFIGFASGILTEWFRDARAYRRERAARLADRDETRNERRYSFQRQSLIDLQDAICELMGEVRLGQGQRTAQALVGKSWDDTRVSVENAQKMMTSRDRLVTLQARISDDLTRALTKALLVSVGSVIAAKSKENATEALGTVKDVLDGVSERIGTVLRTLDDAEDHEHHKTEGAKPT